MKVPTATDKHVTPYIRTYLFICFIPIVLHGQLNQFLANLRNTQKCHADASGSAQPMPISRPYRGGRSRYGLQVWIQTRNDIVSLLQLRLHIRNIIRSERTLQQCGNNFDGGVGLTAGMNVLCLCSAIDRHDKICVFAKVQTGVCLGVGQAALVRSATNGLLKQSCGMTHDSLHVQAS